MFSMSGIEKHLNVPVKFLIFYNNQMNILIKIYLYMYDSIFETVWLDAMTSFNWYESRFLLVLLSYIYT